MIPDLPKGYSNPVKIGNGGFGEVFRVRQDALNRFVALKFIHDKSAKNRKSLKVEAEMQAGLLLNGIPQIYDVVEYSNTICIVMQWVQGCNLNALKAIGISDSDKWSIVTEILKIIISLHNKGYAHRDIKPENILISVEGVFLIDFGLSNSKLIGNRDTNPNVVKGTYEYIAPELWQGIRQLSDFQRADIYSLGKVIAELFDHTDLPKCVLIASSNDPNQRYETVQELFDACSAFNVGKSSYWRETAPRVADDILTDQLLSSARNLLGKGRRDEAYQLLVESIQINPESPAAIEMMERFPVQGQNRNTSFYKRIPFVLPLWGSVIVLIILLISQNVKKVLISEKTDNPDNTTAMSMEPKMWQNSTYNRTLPFKEIPLNCTNISGRLIVGGCPVSGHIVVDEKYISVDTGVFHFPFPLIEHKLLWITTEGNVVWKEIVTILPFEEKRIWIKK